jgi:hypothetical protein
MAKTSCISPAGLAQGLDPGCWWITATAVETVVVIAGTVAVDLTLVGFGDVAYGLGELTKYRIEAQFTNGRTFTSYGQANRPRG